MPIEWEAISGVTIERVEGGAVIHLVATETAPFTWYPTWVEPEAPDLSVGIIRCENFKKDFQLFDASELLRYHLIFEGVSDSDRNAMISHYTSKATGPYNYFEWGTVPSYLNEGSSFDVRYVKDSYEENPNARSWEIKVIFEKRVVVS